MPISLLATKKFEKLFWSGKKVFKVVTHQLSSFFGALFNSTVYTDTETFN